MQTLTAHFYVNSLGVVYSAKEYIEFLRRKRKRERFYEPPKKKYEPPEKPQTSEDLLRRHGRK